MRSPSTFVKKRTTAVSASRPSHGIIWCAGAPLKTYFTPSMFRQQEPNPGAGRWVSVLECDRTATSSPAKTPRSFITVFDGGGIISSAGVPITVTVPGVPVRVRNSATATAAASPIGPCALC